MSKKQSTFSYVMLEIARAIGLEKIYREHVYQATPYYAMPKAKFIEYRKLHFTGWPVGDGPMRNAVFISPTKLREPREAHVPTSLLK